MDGNGGCKDLLTGVIYSASSNNVYATATSMNWYNAVWDSTTGAMDPAKSGESTTNDMDAVNASGVGTDFDDEAYCHNAHWNGFYNWRPPTFAEIDAAMKRNSVGGRNGYTYLRYNTALGIYLWSGKTNPASTGQAYMLNLGPVTTNTGKWYNQTNGVLSSYAKTTSYYGICVRDANATSAYTPLDQ